MQFRIPFRVVRGLTVIVAIVVAHYSIAWGLNHLRISTPDLGPVFATLIGDPEESDDSKNSTDTQDAKSAPDSKGSKGTEESKRVRSSRTPGTTKETSPGGPDKAASDTIPVQIVDETPRKAAPR